MVAYDANAAAAPLQAGDPRQLGAYELIGRLGSGGQGAVFLASAPDGRRVAVKLLHPDQTEDAMARERFVREAHAAKSVARFCAAQVLDADVAGDRPYIVSEYVAGPSLYELVADQGPITGAALERLAIGTATALVAIHQAGIVHRDLKPGNVLVAPDGPRVIDFGIAKALDTAATMSSRVVGTPAYMSPEQLSGAAIAPAVDVFAWGATMVFVATGRAPFGTDSIPLVVNRIVNGQPELGGMSGPVRELVADCLAKDPRQRPTARQILLRLLGQEDAAQAAMPQAAAAPVEADVLLQGATIAASRTNPRPPATEQVAPYAESTWTSMHGPNSPQPHPQTAPNHQSPAQAHPAQGYAAQGHPGQGHGAVGAFGAAALGGQAAYGLGAQEGATQTGGAYNRPQDQATQPPVQFHTPAPPAPRSGSRSKPGLRRRTALACTGGVLAAAAVGFFALTALSDTKDVEPTSGHSSSAPAQQADPEPTGAQYGQTREPTSAPVTDTPTTTTTTAPTNPYPNPQPSHTPTTDPHPSPTVTPTEPPTDPKPDPDPSSGTGSGTGSGSGTGTGTGSGTGSGGGGGGY